MEFGLCGKMVWKKWMSMQLYIQLNLIVFWKCESWDCVECRQCKSVWKWNVSWIDVVLYCCNVGLQEMNYIELGLHERIRWNIRSCILTTLFRILRHFINYPTHSLYKNEKWEIRENKLLIMKIWGMKCGNVNSNIWNERRNVGIMFKISRIWDICKNSFGMVFEYVVVWNVDNEIVYQRRECFLLIWICRNEFTLHEGR